MWNDRQMHLVAFPMADPTCHHHGAWRHPDSTVVDLLNPSRYEHIARVLEAGCVDALFFADILGPYNLYDGRFDTMVGRGGQACLLDPAVVLPMMARVTEHIGLGLTYSSTFNHPDQIMQMLVDLFDDYACDGFVLTPTTFPGMFEQFSRSVVPLLQKRGLFRKQYAGRTLRESLRGRPA